MPHIMKESHLEEICANCKKPHGNQDITLLMNHHNIYEVIKCQSCGYEIIKLKTDGEITSRVHIQNQTKDI